MALKCLKVIKIKIIILELPLSEKRESILFLKLITARTISVQFL